MKKWIEGFDERQQREVEFSRIYALDFKHGTDGHNAKMIIARMAAILDNIEITVNDDTIPAEDKPYHIRLMLGYND